MVSYLYLSTTTHLTYTPYLFRNKKCVFHSNVYIQEQKMSCLYYVYTIYIHGVFTQTKINFLREISNFSRI